MPEVLKKLAAFVGGKTAGAIVTTLVGLGITALVVRSCGDETTIGEIRSDLVKQGYEISAYRKLTLHPGTESYLLALRPATNALSADEIRIYDKGDDAPRLTFRPRIDHPAWPPALGLRFEVVRIGDFGNDGLREIVASYTLEAANATVRLPVAIGWEEAHQRYRLEPLLARRFPLTNLALSLANAPGGTALYTKPYAVHDLASGRRFRSLSVHSLTVIPDERGGDLVGTFPVSSPTADPQLLQVSGWFLSFKAGRPSSSLACFMGRPRGFRLAVRRRPSDPPRYLIASAPRDAKPEKVATTTWESALEQDRSARSGAVRSGLYLGSEVRGTECFFGE